MFKTGIKIHHKIIIILIRFKVMINTVSKFFILIFYILLTFSCSDNRFKYNSDLNSFSFGFAGYDDYQFCNKIDPTFIDPYLNGKNPSKTCIYYQYYTCHINYYCKGDKQCENEATQFWLKPWRDLKTLELLDPAIATKKICDKEQQRNLSPKG